MHRRDARPEALTWADVAGVYGRVLGRDVLVDVVGPDGDLASLSPMMAVLLAAMESYDSVIDPAPGAATFGIVPTRLEEVVRRTLPASA